MHRSLRARWACYGKPASSQIDGIHVQHSHLPSWPKHAGYGFLYENPEFAERCAQEGIAFIGPKPEVMRGLGNKVAAGALAGRVGVPVAPATNALPNDIEEAKEMAAAIGYPLMLKAGWGGGGRGTRAIQFRFALASYVIESQ